jgi:hypothetical protein
VQNGQVLAMLAAASGQNFVVDIVNPFAPGVLSAILAGLHI